MKTENKTVTVLAALLVMLLWGSLFPAVKLGYAACGINTSFIPDILTFAGTRFTVCGIIITAFAALTKKEMKVSVKRELPNILLVGLVSIAVHYTCNYIALSNVDSGKTALLKQLAVALFIPFSFIFVKTEKFRFTNIIAAILCLTGIAVLNLSKLKFSFGIYEALILVASICTVANNVIAKKSTKTVNPIVMTGYAQIFGGALLLIIGLITGGRIRTFDMTSALTFLYIISASTVSYCLWYSLVKNGNLSSLFIIKFAEPLFAALIGALLLKENPFTLNFLTAFLLIVAAVTFTSFKIPKKKTV